MPGVDGIEATRRLAPHGAGAAVLVLTTFDLDEYVYEALRAGAGGFLLKDAPPRPARRGACAPSPPARRCWRPPSRAGSRAIRAPAAARRGRRPPFAELTEREVEVSA